MAEPLNFVLILTDTQTKRMVGAYGEAPAGTPHLDALAASGIRFDNAYTACPLCTPARSGIFTGMYPASNGAYANNIAPGLDVALMGEMFMRQGYRAAYTGKWHLDGAGYFGDGVPAGGFEPDWWYDGYRYAEDLGPQRFETYRRSNDEAELAAAGLDQQENLWGYRVADRACDFLQRVGDDEPFLLVVSFDEPHGPFRCPPEYRQGDVMAGIPAAGGYGNVPDDEPALHGIARAGNRYDPDQPWEQVRDRFAPIWACNRWIDTQIGRVIEAVDQRFADNTVIVYTSDHGEQQLEHGLHSKGPMMYQQSINVPLLARVPGRAGGIVDASLQSHLDLIPTFLDMAGLETSDRLQGVSQASVWRGEQRTARDAVFSGFHRFAVNHDSWGQLYPVRTIVADGWKLNIHLDDSDQLFHLDDDPDERHNRIHDADAAAIRDRLHDQLLAEMDRTRDPFRTWRWANRSWRDQIVEPFYRGGARRGKPAGFPWQPQGIEAH